MSKINELTESYLAILEITPEDAKRNAEYIYKNVIVQDEEGENCIGESMKAIVRIIEYIENPEKTEKFIAYYEEYGKEPDWASDNDFGMKGIMLPYLSEVPKEHINDTVYLATVEAPGYKNEEGKEALIVSRIKQVEDFKQQL